jgi:hypothetical protein
VVVDPAHARAHSATRVPLPQPLTGAGCGVCRSKLKIRSHNAVFGLRTVLCIGEGMVTCVATGTSVLLSALPIPQPLVMMRSDVRVDYHQTSHHVKMLMNISNENRQAAQKARDLATEEAALSQVAHCVCVRALVWVCCHVIPCPPRSLPSAAQRAAQRHAPE